VEYPIFHLPVFGGSLLIGSVAILHVFIAQFAVGSGVFLAIAERQANHSGDTDTLAFLKKYSLAVLLIPYVIGTITGVGIWFVTSIVHPRAISVMIHLFVWAWAAEWTMFVVDVAAIYLYYYTWERIRPAAHNAICWIFACSSVVTLVLINGILSFMLTPGRWDPLAACGFWKAFFNPSFWPTTLMRLFVSLALAGTGAIALLALGKEIVPRVREAMTKLAYRLMLSSLLCVGLMVWAFMVIPTRSQEFLKGSAIPMVMFMVMGMTCFCLLALGSIIAMLRREHSPSVLGACLLCFFALVSYASFEFVREGVRKPYVIEGFMYSTGVTTPQAKDLDRRANLALLRARGLLSAAPWALPLGKAASEVDPRTKGRAVFEAACAACHQLRAGYNALQPLVQGWTAPALRRYLDTMHEQKAMMPPFPGTDDEKDALTAFITALTENRLGEKTARNRGIVPTALNPDLIPSHDMLGIPAKPLPVLVLMNLTLAGHWMFIGAAFGATSIVLLNSLRKLPPDSRAGMNQAILAFLPFTLSMGVTLGIAPLLFVQVLYGNFFYTANVLIAGWWLLIIPLIIANMYLFYLARNRLASGKPHPTALPAVMLLSFVILALILSSNMTLMQRPPDWQSVWLHGRGAGWYLGDSVVPRAIFAILAFLTIGGIAVAGLGKAGLMYDEELGKKAATISFRTAFVTSILQLGAALGLLLFLEAGQRRALLAGGIITVFATFAAIVLLTIPFLLHVVRKAASLRAIVLIASLYFAGLVALAFVRDGLRQMAIAPHFKLASVPVHPQWGPFGLFLVFLVIAVAAVAALLRLASVRK